MRSNEVTVGEDSRLLSTPTASLTRLPLEAGNSLSIVLMGLTSGRVDGSKRSPRFESIHLSMKIDPCVRLVHAKARV